MIQKVNDAQLNYIKNILLSEFDINYNKNEYSKEYIYIINDNILGFIIYELIYDRIELDYIYVLPNNRGKGIASKLIESMIKLAEDKNLKNITLEVNINNNIAISLYEKYGFVIVATRKGYYHGQDGYLMIRE